MNTKVHFQEGFANEEVVVSVDGRTVAAFDATTRTQIGFAHALDVELTAGAHLAVTCRDGQRAEFRVHGSPKFVLVSKGPSGLALTPTDEEPKYA